MSGGGKGLPDRYNHDDNNQLEAYDTLIDTSRTVLTNVFMSQSLPLPKRAIVIGAGFSGLATAALLAHDGWSVTVLEKNATVGGRARVLKKQGFTFDMGPSWYLMPEVFERFFSIFGKKTSDFYQLKRLSPSYRVAFADGENLDVTNSTKDTQNWMEKLEPGAGKRFSDFLAVMKKTYQLSTERLVYLDVFSWRDWLNWTHFSTVVKLSMAYPFWQSWDSFVARFFKHLKIHQLLTFPAVFLGGSPFNTPALYSILSWADFGKGVWYPVGGMGKIVEALVAIAESQGVTIKTKAEVNTIVVKNGRVTGVRVGKLFLPAEVVVGASDLATLETKLLSPQHQTYPEAFWRKQTMGISAVLLYLGIKKRLKNVLHHTLYFSEKWHENFAAIFKHRQLPTNPSWYASVRSISDRSIVPAGAEELFVLVPIAARTDYSGAELKALADGVISHVEQTFGQTFSSDIVVKQLYTPSHFAADYGAYQGTALGIAHTLRQSLWGRPRGKSRKVAGLYYAGQYTNPGVGVPMALISGQIAARTIDQDYNDAQKVFKNGSTTYYYSSLFFSGQVKKDVFSLYSYVRQVDNVVDQTKPDLDQLEKIWTDTVNEWETASGSIPYVKRFVRMAQRLRIEWSWVEAFWQSMRRDLTGTPMKSYRELEQYMYGSAEVIGLMMSAILELPAAAHKTARLEGRAMQLINFIRDVKEDAELGRNYLGYTPADIATPAAWQAFIKPLLDRYEVLQREAAAGYEYIPRAYRVPIKTAADMYWWTAQAIKRDPMVVWKRKLKPSPIRVVLQVLKNWWKT